jgi:hypothetical protein
LFLLDGITGGRGLDEFRDEMLKDKRIKAFTIFQRLLIVFQVEIQRWSLLFLWEKE